MSNDESIDEEWEMMDCEGGTHQVMETWLILIGKEIQLWTISYTDGSVIVTNTHTNSIILQSNANLNWRLALCEMIYCTLKGTINSVIMNDGTEIHGRDARGFSA